jgi:hypothetical protein
MLIQDKLDQLASSHQSFQDAISNLKRATKAGKSRKHNKSEWLPEYPLTKYQQIRNLSCYFKEATKQVDNNWHKRRSQP